MFKTKMKSMICFYLKQCSPEKSDGWWSFSFHTIPVRQKYLPTADFIFLAIEEKVAAAEVFLRPTEQHLAKELQHFRERPCFVTFYFIIPEKTEDLKPKVTVWQTIFTLFKP